MISIIVPIYNAEPFLSKCLESILNQTYKDFELILINDGSTDNSGELCQHYRYLDKRIVVINQENRGSSYTRNLGLDKSRGEWIIHIDADDWLEPDMLEKMINLGEKENADIVACAIKVECRNKSLQRSYSYMREDNLNQRIVIDVLNSAFWNKLIKRELYIRTGARSIEGVKMWDDVVVTSILRWNSTKTVIINEPLYHYRNMGQPSISIANAGQYPADQIKVAMIVANYLNTLKDGHNDSDINRTINYLKIKSKMSLLTPSINANEVWISHNGKNGIKLWKEIFPESVVSMALLSIFSSKYDKLKLIIASILPCHLAETILTRIYRLK